MFQRILAKLFTLFFVMVFAFSALAQSASSPEDTKKEADKLFKNEEYDKAYKLYSQLVSNYPKDPDYNYRLGVCMIYSEPDKTKCISYLKSSVGGFETSKEATFYLGKAYHINYRFDEAIKYYKEYKTKVSSSQARKMQVDRELAACVNGKHLLSNLSDLAVLNKKQLNEQDYFRSYDLRNIGGKLLVKPDEFKTSVDKKKKDKSVVFVPKSSNTVYYSSYGSDDDNGRDIYTITKGQNGEYGKPQKLQGINTEYDEDYPFMHPDGKTLYFASKGYNSMGGYDIFKSVYNDQTNAWSTPVNLQFPINSPDDDYLFVTDSLENIAYFSTGRQSPPGKIDVLKIKTERKPIDLLVIKGTVTKENSEQSVNSVINIKTKKEIPLGTYNASENGDYSLELPNGAELLFTVQTPGQKTQSQTVILPKSETSKLYRQIISYENGELKITNYFDEASSDEDYLQYIDLIEKKAKLDVNEEENKQSSENPDQPLLANNSATATLQTTSENKDNKSASSQTLANEANVKNDDDGKKRENDIKLANRAKQEAVELTQEAFQLEEDSKQADRLGKKQKEYADKKQKEANEALRSAELIYNDDKKKIEMEKAMALKLAADKDKQDADKIMIYSKLLGEEAKSKKQEAELNTKYAQALENIANGKSNEPENELQLEDLKKQINETAYQKTHADEKLENIKSEIDLKEQKIGDIKKTNTEIQENIQEIKTTLVSKEETLANAKNKSEKQETKEYIAELKLDLAEKEKQLADYEAQIKTLNEELVSMKNEMEVAEKIKAEEVANKKEKGVSDAPDLKPIKAAVNAEAVRKLDNLSTQLSISDNVNFEYNAYQNPKAQVLRTEANTKISDASVKQKKLKEIVDQSKTQIQVSQESESIQQLIKEAEELQNKALELSNLANTKSGGAKEKLLNDAKNKEDKANEKYLQASEITKQNNASTYTVNTKNTEILLKGNKLPKSDLTEVEQLSNEANTAYKQAESIRQEAQTLTDKGAILGALSNAEEKEAEALLKQQQAIEILKKGNPNAELEVPILAGDLTSQLQNVNNKLSDVVNVKLESYQKLYQANDEELSQLNISIKKKQESLDKTPNLKDEFDAGNTKVDEAKNLKQKSDDALNSNQKLNQLIIAVKKQNEALKQLGALSRQLSGAVAIKGKDTDFTDMLDSDIFAIAAQNNTSNNSAETKETTQPESIKKETDTKKEETVSTPITQTPVDSKPLPNNTDNENTTKQTSDKAPVTNPKTDNADTENAVKSNVDNEDVTKSNDDHGVVVKPETNEESTIKSTSDHAVVTKSETDEESTIKSNNDKEVVAKPKKDDEGIIKPSGKNDQPITKSNTPTIVTPFAINSNDSKNDVLGKLEQENTTVGQVANYFEANPPALRNEQAAATIKNLVSEIKRNEEENQSIDAKLKNNYSGEAFSGSIDEAKDKISSLQTEADKLNKQAQELRNQAATKTGSEKDNLLQNAKTMDEQSQALSLQVAIINQTINEAKYQATGKAIGELLNKLKNTNQDLYAELAEKNAALTPLNNQVQTLRAEARTLDDYASKLGTMSNAEDKENLLLQNQAEIMEALLKEYPDYTPVEPDIIQVGGEPPVELLQRKKEIQENQFSGLTNLTNALSLEYESSKNAVPENLNKDQSKIRQLAEELNAESKQYLIKSSEEKDEAEKTKLLTMSAKSGKAALDYLNALMPANPVSGVNSEPKKNVSSAESINKNPGGRIVHIPGLDIIAGDAYNNTKPIPIDVPMGSGLVFRVQIGAFKTLLANNTFKGLNPLNIQTAPNGYYRYTAGNFNQYELANAVKNDLKNIGYSDAFVVAFYNNKRITLSEALDMLNKEGKVADVSDNAMQTAGITANANVPDGSLLRGVGTVQNIPVAAKELEQTKNLLFTVQIGVYGRASKQNLLNLRPVFTEAIQGGMYRYTAGIYNDINRVIADKKRVVELGIRDAFVTAYLNGKRIAYNEAKRMQAEDANIRMEAQNPIIFPGTNVAEPAQTINNSVQPFTNGVRSYPEATSENGVKQNETGISFKVQVGAFSNQVPADIAEKFMAVKTWPVEHKTLNGLYVYNVGNFSEAKFAQELKEEIKRLGINDAFVTVYKDGKKLPPAEAYQYLAR